MRLRVRGIDKLPRNPAARRGRGKLVRLCDRALHALGALGQNDFGAVCFGKLPPFDRHRFRHRQDHMISARRRDGRKADARIARGGFDDRCARFQNALRLGVQNHGPRNAVLHAARRIEEFQLRQDFRLQTVFFFNIGQLEQRRSADQLRHLLIYLHNSLLLLPGPELKPQ